MKRRFALALVLVSLSASWAAAQVPAGGEFRVNAATLEVDMGPAVASDANGNFVAVWAGLDMSDSGRGYFGRQFDASGAPLGAEFQIASYTHYLGRPAVASDLAGNFVVVWRGAEAGSQNLFARRYDPSGAPSGAPFQVNTGTGYMDYPSVATDRAGNFVVVWMGSDGSYAGIFGRRFDASGAPRGLEFRVNQVTAGPQQTPSVASDDAGDFVVVWESDASATASWEILGRRYDSAGVPRGGEFQVNTYTTGDQGMPAVASDADGDYVVVWLSYGQDGDRGGIYGQRYSASGTPAGAEFRVNTDTASNQYLPSVASDREGDFVVAWTGWDADVMDVFAQRFDRSGAMRGSEFRVNTLTTSIQRATSVATDSAGNFVVVWETNPDAGNSKQIAGQRFGGLVPAALSVDALATPGSDGNTVLEPGECVDVKPSWKNVNGTAQNFLGGVLSFGGPQASGVSYELQQAVALYGTVENGATASCSTCFQLGVSTSGVRPATHWDATLTERLSPDSLGQTMPWKLHIGESFSDVPKTSGYYRFVETLLHKGITGGCSPTTYCPAGSQTREQMAVFALVAKEGAGYTPPACTTQMFADVPLSSPNCRWIEEAARRGVVAGCGGGNYCPTAEVPREQMPVFMLRTLDPALNPPACGTPMFGDVPASSPYCRWVEELARRGVVTGCGNGNYCPADAVTREQMAVFISATFGLTLYGP